MPTQQPPIVEYPHARGTVGQSGYCTVLRLQRALDYYLTCSFTPNEHR